MKKSLKYSNILLRCIALCFLSIFLQAFCVKKTRIDETSKKELANILDNRPNQIIENTGYTVSYNKNWKIPNWVAYQLTAQETMGEVPRSNNFFPDPQAGGVVTSTYDYRNSGYDRGHMAPAADMKWSQAAMNESFYLSNICPQNHNLNDGDWRVLEEKVRNWAKKYGHIYIACGPIVTENHHTIGYNEIAVPEKFFKVLLKETDGIYETIGFLFSNEAGHKPLSSYAVSVDSIEAITNIDFFCFLPDSVCTWESTYSLQSWNLN